MQFDLELFKELNSKYADRRTHQGRSNKAAKVQERGQRRARWLESTFGVRGKRCLEVGCGRGEVTRVLADQYGCSAVGVDVERYPEWKRNCAPRSQLMQRDISSEQISDLGQFDLIYSFSVWEHIRRPYEALAAVKRLLAPSGDFYLSANLYRGSQASHRYRDVFFPWPHLLFSDEVFEAFYRDCGRPARRAAWVNRLSAADYHLYFRTLGFSAVSCSYATMKWDEAFYRQFEDILGRFPREDLERDFINVHLRHKARWRRLGEQALEFNPASIEKKLKKKLRRVLRRIRRSAT